MTHRNDISKQNLSGRQKETLGIEDNVIVQREKLLNEINNLKKVLSESAENANPEFQRALKEIILSDIIVIEDKLREFE
jgi:hypothetical protein